MSWKEFDRMSQREDFVRLAEADGVQHDCPVQPGSFNQGNPLQKKDTKTISRVQIAQGRSEKRL